MYAWLAVTCHLHFWQNDRDFLRATVVTRGWNGYRNKSQHRKSTLEKKILPPFQQGFEPATFQSRVRRSNHWAVPAPRRVCRCWLQLIGQALGNCQCGVKNVNYSSTARRQYSCCSVEVIHICWCWLVLRFRRPVSGQGHLRTRCRVEEGWLLRVIAPSVAPERGTMLKSVSSWVSSSRRSLQDEVQCWSRLVLGFHRPVICTESPQDEV